MDNFYYYFVIFCISLVSNTVHSNGQSFPGDCQILYQCQSEAIKLTQSNHQTGYHGLGLSWSSTTCGVIRQKLACIVNLAQTCSSRDDLTTKPTWSIVNSTRSYLIEKCSANRDWSESNCFQSAEINKCLSTYQLKPDDLSPESCSNYQSFKKCVDNHVNLKCSTQDKEFNLLYLIGKAQNLTWMCANQSIIQLNDQPEDFTANNPFGNHIGKRGSPNYDFVPQNDDRFHSADNEFNNRANGLWFQTNRFPVDFNNLNIGSQQTNQPFGPFGNSPGSKDLPNGQMHGDGFYQPINSYPPPPQQPPPLTSSSLSQSNQAIQNPTRPSSDRFFGRPPLNQLPNEMYFNSMSSPSSMPILSDQQIPSTNTNKQSGSQPQGLMFSNNINRVDSCLQRANVIGRHCEEALSQRQDLTRGSISPRDLKSGHCCGLLRYSDCFGKILDQVCPNIDANSVIRSIPDNRRQDMNACKSYGPFNCNYMNSNSDFAKPSLAKSLQSIVTLIAIFIIIN